jgi:two-component system, NtrC family, sensor histidine kinase KinB
MHADEHYPYKALYKLARDLYTARDAAAIMNDGLVRGAQMTGAAWGCLLTLHNGDTVKDVFTLNLPQDQPTGDLWPVLLTRGPLGFAYHARRTIIIRDLSADTRWPVLAQVRALPNEGSIISLPLTFNGEIGAVMMLGHPQIDYFTTATSQLVEEIAALIAEAVSTRPDNSGSDPQVSYQILFDDALVPIILTDTNGQITNVNRQAANLLSYDPHNLIQRPLTTIHPNFDASIIGRSGLSDLQIGEEVAFRTTAISAHFEEIPVIVRMRRLDIESQGLIEWVEQDITAQMELEQLRRDLSAMVYHDLRGPLQAIGLSVQKLAQVLANHENPAVLTFLQTGLRSTRQLRRMIDNLLDIQRLEEGRAMLDRSQIELRVLLTDAVQLVQPVIVESGQQLQINLADNLPPILLDNDMILRVVVNLLENATKYTPRGGTLQLDARVQNDRLAITVADSGPGIPTEMQNRIFDKFNRVKYQDGPKGIGLGLAFCRLAVDAHGGQIWVESEPGKGSKFTLSLPLNTSEADDPFSQLIKTV